MNQLTHRPAWPIYKQSKNGIAADHFEATTEVGESVRVGMASFSRRDAIIRNIYSKNVSKLAARLSASQVERG